MENKAVELVVVDENGEAARFSLREGESIFSCLLREGMISMATCGGRGTCMRCGIELLEGKLPVQPKDRKAFTRKELDRGMRLACTAKPGERCVIRTRFQDRESRVSGREGIVSGTWLKDGSGRKGGGAGTGDFIAMDLGTTTIVMEWVAGSDGKSRGLYKAMNPQRSYGADVLSRIQASNDGEGERLRSLILNQINQGYQDLLETVGEKAPENLYIAANTAMTHLLLGLSCRELGKAPFNPVTLDFEEPSGLPLRTVVLPGISAFVGGDILSGLFAVSADVQDKRTLFIDLGTNGEMALCRSGEILCTAAAAGPAFEGGFTAGLPGSDLIRIAASLLDSGLIDETGFLTEPYFEAGYPVKTEDGREALLTQRHIRDLQMAKAAVRAGIEILLEKAGLVEADVDRVYLAGGFGYYLDPRQAERIGLLPPGLCSKAAAAGNTSLAGAVRFGLDEAEGRRELIRLKGLASAFNLADQPGFYDRYIGSLNFPS